MKTIMKIGLALLLPMSAWAQTTATSVYREGQALVDNTGNLLVFDSGRSTTGVTITGQRHSFYAPLTRVTVQHPGTTGNVQTVTYDGALQLIGAGNSAVFAIATVYTVSGTTVTTTSSLVAIKGSQTLPAAVSGFPSFALTSRVDVRVGANDYITLITDPDRSSTTTTRTATVLHFNGTSFETTSTGTLP